MKGAERATLPPFCTLSFVKLIPYGKKLEVKSLIFVTADSCRSQLEGLTQLLISVFPGSTIYQHTDLCRVPHDVLNNNVDAVFLEAEMDKTNGLDFLQMLRRVFSFLSPPLTTTQVFLGCQDFEGIF